MRSRRSSRPSWSSSALTLAAAGSLRMTPVAASVVSCTVMFCPPTSLGARCGTSRSDPTPPWRSFFHCTARIRVSPVSFPTHVDFEPVKLRLPGRRDRAETSATTPPDASVDLTEQLVRSSGKGRPTPKRSEAQGRRPGPPPPPPTTRKEAYKRMRAQQADRRAQTRLGAARGDEAYLPVRDRGPVRKLVRDIVDARRNIGSLFLAVAGVALVGTIVPNLAVRSYSTFFLFGYFILLVADSFVLGRRISRTVAERFPEDKRGRGTV